MAASGREVSSPRLRRWEKWSLYPLSMWDTATPHKHNNILAATRCDLLYPGVSGEPFRGRRQLEVDVARGNNILQVTEEPFSRPEVAIFACCCRLVKANCVIYKAYHLPNTHYKIVTSGQNELCLLTTMNCCSLRPRNFIFLAYLSGRNCSLTVVSM